MNNNNKLTSIIFALAFFGSVNCSTPRSYLDSRPGQVGMYITKTATSDLFSLYDNLILLVYKQNVYKVLNISATTKTNFSPKSYEPGKVLPPIYLKEKKQVVDNDAPNNYYTGLLVKDVFVKELSGQALNSTEAGAENPSDVKQSNTGYRLFFAKKRDSNGAYVFSVTTITTEQLEQLTTFPGFIHPTDKVDTDIKDKVDTGIKLTIGEQGYKVMWDRVRRNYNLEEETESAASSAGKQVPTT